jgi:hypothetical protein
VTTTSNPEQVYAVVVETMVSTGDGVAPRLEWVEAWPRTAEGAINATTRACRMSRRRDPHEVHLPGGQLLARYEDGRRADLPPGGIIKVADARLAGMDEIVHKIARHM